MKQLKTLLWLHFTISTTSGDGVCGAEMANGGVRGGVIASRGDFGEGSIWCNAFVFVCKKYEGYWV